MQVQGFGICDSIVPSAPALSQTGQSPITASTVFEAASLSKPLFAYAVVKLFEQGVELSNSCRKELEEAEGRVEILLKQNGKLQAEAFEPTLDRAEAKRT